MTPETARIIRIDTAEPPRDWGRFVALLCMLMFYTRFVEGTYYLLMEGDILNNPNRRLVELASVGLALVMLFCAHALWRNSRHRCWHLASAIVAILAYQAVAALYTNSCCIWHSFTLWNRIQIDAWIGVPIIVVLRGLSWTSVIVTAIWLERRSGLHPPRRYHIWATLAMVWCVVMFLLRFQDLYKSIPAMWFSLLGDNLYLQPFSSFLMAFAPCMVLVGLIRGSRWAAWPAFLITCLIVVPSVFYAWGYSWLIRDMAQTAFNSLPPKLLGKTSLRFPLDCCYLNTDLFQAVFVTHAMSAGPWLLIAYYARHYPIRIPPDDGSPYPRRYCGNCEYNLHGIEAIACPECGRQLVA